jgi:hypothetical protein
MAGSGDDAQPVTRVRFKLYDRNRALMDLAKVAGVLCD